MLDLTGIRRGGEAASFQPHSKKSESTCSAPASLRCFVANKD